jgi:hypothetical protein
VTGTLTAFIDGVGVLGPGITDWPAAARILRGEAPYAPLPTVLPAPERLPSAERRRTGAPVRLALAVGLEATARAGVDPSSLPAVFSSSGGDGDNCHEICQALASAERALSPTRFHNSVHNAAAGYWDIAAGATRGSNALCAYDASFGAGLLEALAQLRIERTPVLLVAYDTTYPEPIRRTRPIPWAFGVALVLAPARSGRSQARLGCVPGHAPAAQLADAALEELRTAVPAARSVPLLAALAALAADAAGAARETAVDYLGKMTLSLSIEPCR